MTWCEAVPLYFAAEYYAVNFVFQKQGQMPG